MILSFSHHYYPHHFTIIHSSQLSSSLCPYSPHSGHLFARSVCAWTPHHPLLPTPLLFLLLIILFLLPTLTHPQTTTNQWLPLKSRNFCMWFFPVSLGCDSTKRTAGLSFSCFSLAFYSLHFNDYYHLFLFFVSFTSVNLTLVFISTPFLWQFQTLLLFYNLSYFLFTIICSIHVCNCLLMLIDCLEVC